MSQEILPFLFQNLVLFQGFLFGYLVQNSDTVTVFLLEWRRNVSLLYRRYALLKNSPSLPPTRPVATTESPSSERTRVTLRPSPPAVLVTSITRLTVSNCNSSKG